MALYMANLGIIPPKEFKHKASIKTNSMGNTVAMLLA